MDPFAATYSGARQSYGTLGEGIQQFASSLAGTIKEKKEQEQLINTLKSFGIIKDKEPGIEDYIKEAKKQTGQDITVTGIESLTPENQYKSVKGLFESLGLKSPKSKGYDVDLSKIPQGMEITDLVPGLTLKRSDTDINDEVKQSLWQKYQAGDRGPEVLKGLGMYTSPQKEKRTYLRDYFPPQKTPTKREGGFFGLGAKETPAWNERTQEVVSNIRTQEDIDDLLENRDYYESRGVDVEAIINHIENTIYPAER